MILHDRVIRVQLRRITDRVEHLINRMGGLEMILDDIKTELDNLNTKFDTLLADVQAALGAGDVAKAQAILTELQAENSKMDGILALFPPAPPAP